VLLVLAAGVVISVRESRRINTNSVDSLRIINTAQVAYAETHPNKGFTSSLAELGPSPGAELIDSVLASGRKSGYVFTLNAGPLTRHAYVVARPEKYGTGSPSFFSDETGVEHFTVENRAATVNDPVRPSD